MSEFVINKNDELVLKLLHYFITEKNYNPIVLHGAKNEVWLENMDEDYKIVRIVSNYIHNNDQLDYDLEKTKSIMKSIKKKTLSASVNTLSIFVNTGDNVDIDFDSLGFNNVTAININAIEDIKKYDNVVSIFPDIIKSTKFEESDVELFMKLSKEINEKNEVDAKKAEDVFQKKTPYITYAILIINVIIFFAMYILGDGSRDVLTLLNFGAFDAELVVNGEYYRLLTSAFLHIGAMHLLFNSYALYIIGPQLENFYGRLKFIVIYLGSAIMANLFSLLFLSDNAISAGASGAIFGLLGALLYFGYHYRVYLGTVIKSQIIPLIVINLLLGFMLAGVNNAAHIGGLIGGVAIAMAVGVKYKSTTFEKINGLIITLILFGFLIYMGFIR